MPDNKDSSTVKKITDIHCPECGAPARFDIVSQQYVCPYCGGKTEIGEAVRQAKGFRKIQRKKMKGSLPHFSLASASCTGCGAEVVFEENEALSGCPFCGRSLVRREYLNIEDIPENVIPFAVTIDEAKQRAREWCEANKGKKEARLFKETLTELSGFYLPYEMIRGPVHMKAARMDRGSSYRCEGFINDEFVNRSGQLDNQLLDGMEPYDTESLTDFEFSYIAGHRVKVPDIAEDELEKRVKKETESLYRPYIRRTLETKAVDVEADVSSAVRLPVLLPVYYICRDGLMAAVNGQTGKVSVRAMKDSHYYFLPWWLKAVIAASVITLTVFGGLCLFGMAVLEAVMICGMLAVVLLIITLCLYSDTPGNSFSVSSGREIFTSGERTFRRENGELVPDEKYLERKLCEPVFFYSIDGKTQPVILRFTTPLRVLKIILTSLGVLFLPVIIALFLNGFDFARLELGGSAVWFCIMIPVIPVYILQYGIVQLYDHPLVYTLDENGKRHLYRRKTEFKVDKSVVSDILRALVVPPVSLAVWFAILSFAVMCWLTAFGF